MTTRRPSAREELLERENAMLRADLERIRKDPGDLPVTGCGDSSCIVTRPTGMRTNGGCRCTERTIRWAYQWWRRRAEFLVETVRELREVRDYRVEVVRIEGDWHWRLRVNGYGVASWPAPKDSDPEEYAKESARVLEEALRNGGAT